MAQQGLQNNGTMCFINSIVQVLNSFENFKNLCRAMNLGFKGRKLIIKIFDSEIDNCNELRDWITNINSSLSTGQEVTWN